METYEEMLKKERTEDYPTLYRILKTTGKVVAFASAILLADNIYAVRRSVRDYENLEALGDQLVARGYTTLFNVGNACIGLGVMAWADTRLRKLKQKSELELIADEDSIDLDEDVVELDEKDMVKE